jgi:hypothetical protein
MDVNVGIDQAGQERLAVRIHDLGTRWDLDLCGRTDMADPVAIDKNDCITQWLTTVAIDQDSRTNR